jgi:hypothetical protein
MRPMGVKTYESPENPLVAEARAWLKRKDVARRERAATRKKEGVPNWKCYLGVVFFIDVNIDENGNWLGGRLPRCRRCDENLQPKEHHTCEGFVPKYMEWTEERVERAEARREAIRDDRWENSEAPAPWEDPDDRVMECACGELIHGIEEAMFHGERCAMSRESIRANYEDDYCEDDGAEEDYCEGDDDGEWD